MNEGIGCHGPADRQNIEKRSANQPHVHIFFFDSQNIAFTVQSFHLF